MNIHQRARKQKILAPFWVYRVQSNQSSINQSFICIRPMVHTIVKYIIKRNKTNSTQYSLENSIECNCIHKNAYTRGWHILLTVHICHQKWRKPWRRT